MVKDAAKKKAARKYMEDHPGTPYRVALQITQDLHSQCRATEAVNEQENQ